MKGVSDRNFLVDALINNTFSLHDVEYNLDNIVKNSFRYLSDDQRDRVGLCRFRFRPFDLKLESDYRYHLVVGKDLIEASCRKSYKESDYFNVEMTVEEMYNKTDIFDKVPLVFIDGHLTFDYKVIPYKDKTDIIFKKNQELLTKRTFDIIYVHLNGIGSARYNKFILEKYPESVPYNKLFTTTNLYGNKEGKIVGVVYDETLGMYSSLFDVIDDGESYTLKMNDYQKALINEQRSTQVLLLNISFVNFKDKVYTTRLNSNNELKAELSVITNNDELYENPIPVENIVVLKKAENGEFRMDNTCTVALHYPNIYEIIDDRMDETSEYKLMYFYVPIMNTAVYKNKLEIFYYLLMKDYKDMTFEDALNDIYFSDKSGAKYYALFDKYFSYADSLYTYSIADFRENALPNHFNYKVDKMWEFIRTYPEHLREYVKSQYKTGRTYFLDVTDIDLENRLRTDTSLEKESKSQLKLFDKECYVFAFRNETDEFLNLAIYIDGLLTIPDHTIIAHGMQYMYIDKDKIKEDSFIEIEKFEGFSKIVRAKLIYGDGGKVINIKTVSESHANYIPTVQDIVYNDALTGEPLDSSEFKVSIEIDDEFSESDPDTFAFLSMIKIELKSELYSGKEIVITIGKYADSINYSAKSGGLFIEKLTKDISELDRKYIHVYMNGRLLPDPLWYLTYAGERKSPYVNVNYVLSKDDTITVLLTPFKYNQVYMRRLIDKDSVIDLRGYINKPFDLYYYDVFINGVKLTAKQVKTITPTKIKLSGVNSLHNFVIYEKDRDSEYFYLDYNDIRQKETVEDELIDDTENLTEEDIKYIIDKLAGEIEENNDSEDIVEPDSDLTQDDFDLVSFYLEVLGPVEYLNPDQLQFVRKIIKQYSGAYEWMVNDGRDIDVNTLWLNPDRNKRASIVLHVGSPE